MPHLLVNTCGIHALVIYLYFLLGCRSTHVEVKKGKEREGQVRQVGVSLKDSDISNMVEVTSILILGFISR